MLNQKPIKELVAKEIVDHFFLLKKIEVKQTRAGKDYLSLDFGDKTGSITGNYWDNFEEFLHSTSQGSIVKVKGYVESFNDKLQIKVERANVVDESSGLSIVDFVPSSKRNIGEMQVEFWRRVDQIENRQLKKLLKIIFDEERFKNFSQAPAGKSWHHSYIGGLLEHTLEVVRICDLMCEIHKELNRDLIVCGAMLHDIGKTEELSYSTSFDYSDKGRLIGHIVLGVSWIQDAIKKISDFPEELELLLLHLILSHQGKLENASPVEPKTLEAIALYHADELSAKTNAYKTLISESAGESNWTRFHSLIGSSLYIPREILDGNSESSSQQILKDFLKGKKDGPSLFD